MSEGVTQLVIKKYVLFEVGLRNHLGEILTPPCGMTSAFCRPNLSSSKADSLSTFVDLENYFPSINQ
jgi:hypothetical protein